MLDIKTGSVKPPIIKQIEIMKTLSIKSKELLKTMNIKQSIEHCKQMCNDNRINPTAWDNWMLTLIELKELKELK